MTQEQKTPAYKSCQIPFHIYSQLEELATKKRMETGADVRWTDYLKMLLEQGISSNESIALCEKQIIKE